MINCAECGAPAEVVDTALFPGVDYDGSDAIFEIMKIECAAGHRYNDIRTTVSGGEDAKPTTV